MPKATRPVIRIHDIENDVVIDREMNDEEHAQYLADGAAEIARAEEEAAKASRKTVLLEKLGITEDEAKLLLA